MALRVARLGGVAAAVAVLKATSGAEALGLLWTLSASKGTLPCFTVGALEAVVNTGRNAGEGWRQTAALSTMHNLLCYDGHDLVLGSRAGSLELAVEILKSDASPSVKSAASKLLDQCCFDERSKLAAVNLLPVRTVADILRHSLTEGCRGSAEGSQEEAHQRALLVLVEDTLSLLWNASDDVFFAQTDDWARVTVQLSDSSLLSALSYCLRSPVLSHQQAASATLHNMASNARLLPQLKQAGVDKALVKLTHHPAPSSICGILALTELCGMREAQHAQDAPVRFNDAIMAAVVHELDRRVAVSASFEDDSSAVRLQEVVGTRKLVSAIDVLASRSDSKTTLLREGAIGVIIAALQQRRTDVRGTVHCINVLMHLSFEPACKLAMQRAHPDLLPTLHRLCADGDAATANAARALVFMLLNFDSLTPRAAPRTSRELVALLSYHEDEAELAARIRSGLRQDNSWRLSAVDDRVCGGDFEQTLSELEDTSVLAVLVSPSLKRSARSRLMLNIAVRRGLHIVPVLAVDGYVPDGWLSALAARSETTHMAAQIPRVGMPVTADRLIAGLEALLLRRAVGLDLADAPHTPFRGRRGESERSGDTGEKESFLTTAAASLVNMLSPRGMPATPRGDMAGPSASPRLGLLLKQNYEGGDVYVGTVVPGGMAARTGAIREGDVITRVDGCTTAGLSVLAVTELIRGLPLSEPKARARAVESRSMLDNEVRITLRRHGRPLEAVMPRPPPSQLQTPPLQQGSPSRQHAGTGSGASRDADSVAHVQAQQSRYNEDAVPPHLRARASNNGTLPERARAVADAAAAQRAREAFGAAVSDPAPDASARGARPDLNLSSAKQTANATTSVPGEQKQVPSLFGKGPFLGAGKSTKATAGTQPCPDPASPEALIKQGAAVKVHPATGAQEMERTGARGTGAVSEVAAATAHESDSEEWIESSSESSHDSRADSAGDLSSSQSSPTNSTGRAALAGEDSWSEGDVSGSVGLKPRKTRVHISCCNAPLSLELLWNLRACVVVGGWMTSSATTPKHRVVLSCVLRAWSGAMADGWYCDGPLECVDNAELMTNAQVMAWLARCDRAANVCWEALHTFCPSVCSCL